MAQYNDMDLANVGQRIKNLGGPSNADTLSGMVGIGLQIMQNLYTNKKRETSADLTSAIRSTSAALKNLDYTQSELEMEIEGETVNVYDWQRKIASKAMENLEPYKDHPLFKKRQGDIDIVLSEFTAALAYQDAMKGQRVEHLGNLEDLHDNMMDLVKSDPSMTDKGTWENWLAMFKDTEKAYNNLEYNSGKKIPADAVIRNKALAQRHDLLSKSIGIDKDRDILGIQTTLEEAASPFLQKFFKAQKLLPEEDITIGPEGEQWQTFMPELDFDTGAMIGPPEKAYELPDIDAYQSALASFNKYQSVQTAVEAQNIVLQQGAIEGHPFEIMRDRMEAPGDAEQLSGANVIASQFFSGTKNTFKENIKDIPSGPYKDDLNELYKQLAVLKAEGRHKTEFHNMQTTYNQVKKATIKATGKTIDQMDSVNAEAVRNTIDNLNTNLAVYNAQSKLKNKPTRQLLEIPNFADKGQTTKQSKVWLTERLGLLLEEANRLETEGNEPGGTIKMIRDFENASGQGQWVAMQKLVKEYLDSNGFEIKDKQEDINDAFDAGKFWTGEEERIDVQSFYAILKAFQALSNADPAGTTEFDYFQSLLNQ